MLVTLPRGVGDHGEPAEQIVLVGHGGAVGEVGLGAFALGVVDVVGDLGQRRAKGVCDVFERAAGAIAKGGDVGPGVGDFLNLPNAVVLVAGLEAQPILGEGAIQQLRA